MKDLMVDIETLATCTNAVIVQLGACYFDRATGSIGETFLANISVQSGLESGLVTDTETIKWWLGQKRITWLEDRLELQQALRMFSDFVNINRNAKIWSHATFDMPIIENAYRKLRKRIPFKYKNARDIRTLVDLSKTYMDKPKENAEKTHNALDDCIRQVEYCTRCFNALRRK